MSTQRKWRRLAAVFSGALLAAGVSAAVAGAPEAHAAGPVPLPPGLSSQSLVQQFDPVTLVSSAWNPSNSPGNCPTTQNGAFVNSSGYAEIDTNGANNDCRSIQSPQASLPTAPGTTYELLQNFSSFQDWPASWMYGPNWPNQGEIDAVEGGPGVSTVTWHQAGNFTIGPDSWDNQQVSLAGNPDIQPGTWTTTDISFTTAGVDVYYNGLLYVHIPESVTTGGTDPMFLTISEGSCNADGTNVCNGGTAPPGSVQTQWVREFSASGGGGQQSPVAATSAAANVTSSAATLNGSVNPEGASTTYKFDYGTSTSYGSSTTQGSAGSGTTAVNESAGTSGLSAGTVYHYRIEATNSGGTTFGADQQFTTSAGSGGTPVAFDATAGGKAANTSSLSWTHLVGSGSNRALLVDMTVGTTSDAGCAPSATYDGIAMQEITAVHTDNQRAGVMVVFGLANPPAGNDTVHVAVANCAASPTAMTGGSESFTGVSQSAPWGAHSIGYGSSTLSSAGVTSASASNLVGEFTASGSQVGTANSPVTAKFTENETNNTEAGDTAGGYAPGASGTVTGTWNLWADWWGAAAVDIAHA